MENLEDLKPEEISTEQRQQSPQAETIDQQTEIRTDIREYSTVREYFITTVVCSIFALFVTTYVVHPMTVPTPSMEPTILVGDRLLIDKFTIRNGFFPGLPITPERDIKRGEIVGCFQTGQSVIPP